LTLRNPANDFSSLPHEFLNLLILHKELGESYKFSSDVLFSFIDQRLISEKSIELDMPFHLAERKERVAFAMAAIDNPTVSPAEGLRQVLETFNVEMEYGRKLDNYKDTIEIEGQQREVNVLRVGRLALVYQSADESLTGAWDNNIDEWVALDSSYRNPTRKGLRIANKLATVDMLELPIQNPEAVQ
jgi:hypothetical protein